MPVVWFGNVLLGCVGSPACCLQHCHEAQAACNTGWHLEGTMTFRYTPTARAQPVMCGLITADMSSMWHTRHNQCTTCACCTLVSRSLVVLWGTRLTYNFWRKGGYDLKFEVSCYTAPTLLLGIQACWFAAARLPAHGCHVLDTPCKTSAAVWTHGCAAHMGHILHAAYTDADGRHGACMVRHRAGLPVGTCAAADAAPCAVGVQPRLHCCRPGVVYDVYVAYHSCASVRVSCRLCTVPIHWYLRVMRSFS